MDTKVYVRGGPAHGDHHQAGAGRVRSAICAVIASPRNLNGIIGHFEDGSTGLIGRQGLPAFTAGHGVFLVSQADHVFLRLPNYIEVEVRLDDVIIIGDRDDLPGTVCLQGLALSHGQVQVVAAIDVQQDTVFRDPAVVLANSGVVIQPPGIGLVPIGVLHSQILLPPCQPTGLGDLALHGDPIDIVSVFSISNKGIGRGSIVVVLDNLGIQLRVAVILVVFVQLGCGAGGHGNGQRIMDTQYELGNICVHTVDKTLRLRHSGKIAGFRHSFIHVLLTDNQQPAVGARRSGMAVIGDGIGAFGGILIIVHHRHLNGSHDNCATIHSFKGHAAPAVSPNTQHSGIDWVIHGIDGHAICSNTLNGFHFLAQPVAAVITKTYGSIEHRCQRFRYGNGHGLGLCGVFHSKIHGIGCSGRAFAIGGREDHRIGSGVLVGIAVLGST